MLPTRAAGSAGGATTSTSAANVDDMHLRAMLFRCLAEARGSLLEGLRQSGCSQQTVSSGTYLMHQGSLAMAGFVIDRGRVKVGRVMEDGSQVILKVAPAGDYIGMIETIADLPYTRYGRAITDVVVWRLDKRQILGLLDRDPQIARTMLVATTVRSLETQLDVAGLHAGPVRVRLVHLLMKLAHETAVGCRDGCVIELELSQEEMASVIGTTRQSVSSLLSALKHEGLTRGGHHTLLIPEWEPLLAWASAPVAE